MHNPNTNFNFGFNQPNNTTNQQQSNTQKLNNFLQTQFYQTSPDLRDLQYRRTCFRDWDTKSAYINHISALPAVKNFTPKEIETLCICKFFLKGTEKENVVEYNRPWNTRVPYGEPGYQSGGVNKQTMFNNLSDQQIQTGSVFGGGNSNSGLGGAPTTFGGFGQAPASTTFSSVGGSTGLFGQGTTAPTFGNTSSTPSIFGNSSSNQTTSMLGGNTGRTSIFGNQPTSSIFGNTTNQTTFGNTTTQSSFGNPSSNQTTFGNITTQPSSIFGNTTTQQSSIFKNTPSNQPTFGQTSTQPTFGQTSTQPTFGQTSTQPSFGQTSTQPSFGQTSTQPSFGQTSTQPSFGQTSNPSPYGQTLTVQSAIFGNTTSQPSFGNTSNQSLFGGQTVSNTPQPSFGNTSSATTSVFGRNAGPTTSIFGGTTNQPTFGGTTTQPSFGNTATQPSFEGISRPTPSIFGTTLPVNNTSIFGNPHPATTQPLNTNTQQTPGFTQQTPLENQQRINSSTPQWNNNSQQQTDEIRTQSIEKKPNVLASPVSSFTNTGFTNTSKTDLSLTNEVSTKELSKYENNENKELTEEQIKEYEYKIIKQPRVDEYYFNDPKFYDFCHKTEIGKKLMEPGFLMFPIQKKIKKMKFELEIWPETKVLLESKDFTKPQKKLKYENNKIIKGDVTFTETFLSEKQKEKLNESRIQKTEFENKKTEFENEKTEVENDLLEKEMPNISSEKDCLSLTEKGIKNDTEPEIQLFPNPALFKGESLIYNAKVVFRNSLVLKFYDPIHSKDFTVENVKEKIILDFIDSSLIKKFTSIKHIKIPTFKDPKNKGLNKSCYCKVFEVNPKNVSNTEKLENQKDLSNFIRVKTNLKKVLGKNFIKYEWTEIGGCLEMTFD